MPKIKLSIQQACDKYIFNEYFHMSWVLFLDSLFKSSKLLVYSFANIIALFTLTLQYDLILKNKVIFILFFFQNFSSVDEYLSFHISCKNMLFNSKQKNPFRILLKIVVLLIVIKQILSYFKTFYPRTWCIILFVQLLLYVFR